MPAWMTSEFLELVSDPIWASASMTSTLRPPIASLRATASPITPAPATTQSKSAICGLQCSSTLGLAAPLAPALGDERGIGEIGYPRPAAFAIAQRLAVERRHYPACRSEHRISGRRVPFHSAAEAWVKVRLA